MPAPPATTPPDEFVATVEREKIPALISALAMRLLVEPVSPPTNTNGVDRMLTAAEAAIMLRRKIPWIYRNKNKLPFVKLGERGLIISERRLRE